MKKRRAIKVNGTLPSQRLIYRHGIQRVLSDMDIKYHTENTMGFGYELFVTDEPVGYLKSLKICFMVGRALSFYKADYKNEITFHTVIEG